MGKRGDGLLKTAIQRRLLGRWSLAGRDARRQNLGAGERPGKRSMQLRPHLDALTRIAGKRLASPDKTATVPAPHNADWAWRPGLWTGPRSGCNLASAPSNARLDDDVKLFHDCNAPEFVSRQLRNHSPEDRAAYGLQLDVSHFEGRFLSVVLDLPQDGSTGLTRTHIVKVDLRMELEKPIKAFARLNVVHGPNTEQFVRELDTSNPETVAEFDLAWAPVNEKRITKAWVDIIFETPHMNRIIIRDVVLSRRPRAQV